MTVISRDALLAAAQSELKSRMTPEAVDAFFATHFPQCHAFKTDRSYRIYNSYLIDSDWLVVGGLNNFTVDMIMTAYDELAINDEQVKALHSQYVDEFQQLRTSIEKTLKAGLDAPHDDLMEMAECSMRYRRVVRRINKIQQDFPELTN